MAPVEDHFYTAGLVFLAESDKEIVKSKAEDEYDCEFDIKSIDIIGNPHFDVLMQHYKLPVMVKAANYTNDM